ncbi:MAG: class I SAM-dependent methyltransferase [Verrucomicrobiota bacterium]|nr:class I SAM-dependent methyltransferase [Verrucomicrobiota bacterium]
MDSQPGFDKLARWYRVMECLLAGNKLQIGRLAHLAHMSDVSHILMLGEGPGRLLEVVAQRFPIAEITVVDQSHCMLAQARQTLKRSNLDPSTIRFIQGDIFNIILPRERFDLVTTPFFLDCFNSNQLIELISRVSLACTTNCHWLLADFQLPETGVWRKMRARCVLGLMYTFFRLVTGITATGWENPDRFLAASGFNLQIRTEYEWGLIRSDWWCRGSRSRETSISNQRIRDTFKERGLGKGGNSRGSG